MIGFLKKDLLDAYLYSNSIVACRIELVVLSIFRFNHHLPLLYKYFLSYPF